MRRRAPRFTRPSLRARTRHGEQISRRYRSPSAGEASRREQRHRPAPRQKKARDAIRRPSGHEHHADSGVSRRGISPHRIPPRPAPEAVLQGPALSKKKGRIYQSEACITVYLHSARRFGRDSLFRSGRSRTGIVLGAWEKEGQAGIFLFEGSFFILSGFIQLLPLPALCSSREGEGCGGGVFSSSSSFFFAPSSLGGGVVSLRFGERSFLWVS